MQGDRVENSILGALKRILDRIDDFDVVVIIRGGGATSDLSGFDTYLLAAACAQFPIPIITGIGHERDDTVLDSVAHVRVKTPTAAAEYLIHCMQETADRLDLLTGSLYDKVLARLGVENRRLQFLRNRISTLAIDRISGSRLALMTIRKDICHSVALSLAKRRHQLELLSQRLADASPQKQLARGYSMTLKDGKVVKDIAELKKGDRVTTHLMFGKFMSEVEKIEK